MLIGLRPSAPGNCPSSVTLLFHMESTSSELAGECLCYFSPLRILKRNYPISKTHFWLRLIKNTKFKMFQSCSFLYHINAQKIPDFGAFWTSDFLIRGAQSLKSEIFQKLKNSIIWILLVPHTSHTEHLICDNSLQIQITYTLHIKALILSLQCLISSL